MHLDSRVLVAQLRVALLARAVLNNERRVTGAIPSCSDSARSILRLHTSLNISGRCTPSLSSGGSGSIQAR